MVRREAFCVMELPAITRKQGETRLDVTIAGRTISKANAPYVIAELSGNHNGDIERAKRLIDAAKWAGADAVKLQTYRPDTITIQSDRPEFQIDSGLWAGRTLYELYEEAHTPWDWHADLFRHAADQGLTIFSSPFDRTAVDLLESLKAPAYKIASAEIVDWGLLEYVAATGKPIIISSGMATDDELDEALTVLRTSGATEIVLLHCISAYPTPLSDANLHRIAYLADRFGVLTGLSDHTMGDIAALAATALGATVIEKHFTLSRADGGVDSAFSLEKEELKQMCSAVKSAHASLGERQPPRPASESETRKFRRSLYFVQDIRAGEVIAPEAVKSIRPGLGLAPRHLKDLIGKTARVDITAGTPTDWSLVSEK